MQRGFVFALTILYVTFLSINWAQSSNRTCPLIY